MRKKSDSLVKSGKEIPRREFLSLTGLTVLGASLFPKTILANSTNIPSAKAKISLQLYTVRNQIKENIGDTLHKLASLGVDTVETAFWLQSI